MFALEDCLLNPGIWEKQALLVWIDITLHEISFPTNGTSTIPPKLQGSEQPELLLSSFATFDLELHFDLLGVPAYQIAQSGSLRPFLATEQMSG